MVEETLFRDIKVPTQEWLSRHTVWYEAETEERKMDTIERRERIFTGVAAIVTFVFIIILFATYGGY